MFVLASNKRARVYVTSTVHVSLTCFMFDSCCDACCFRVTRHVSKKRMEKALYLLTLVNVRIMVKSF